MDPIENAIAAHHGQQEAVFYDFGDWRKARHPDRTDIDALADEYARDIVSGAWPAKEPTP